jgi:hypothetical protein
VSKVRVTAQWLEARGFKTQLVERRFEAGDSFHDRDPRLILAGVDAPESRLNQALAVKHAPNGAQLIDGGLGSGPTNFDEIALHSSPVSDADIARWRDARERHAARVERISASPRMLEVAAASQLDACGTVRLAQIAVGVPYVGVGAGALVIAECLRRLAGRSAISAATYRLRDLAFANSPILHGVTPAPIASISVR